MCVLNMNNRVQYVCLYLSFFLLCLYVAKMKSLLRYRKYIHKKYQTIQVILTLSYQLWKKFLSFFNRHFTWKFISTLPYMVKLNWLVDIFIYLMEGMIKFYFSTIYFKFGLGFVFFEWKSASLVVWLLSWTNRY